MEKAFPALAHTSSPDEYFMDVDHPELYLEREPTQYHTPKASSGHDRFEKLIPGLSRRSSLDIAVFDSDSSPAEVLATELDVGASVQVQVDVKQPESAMVAPTIDFPSMMADLPQWIDAAPSLVPPNSLIDLPQQTEVGNLDRLLDIDVSDLRTDLERSMNFDQANAVFTSSYGISGKLNPSTPRAQDSTRLTVPTLARGSLSGGEHDSGSSRESSPIPDDSDVTDEKFYVGMTAAAATAVIAARVRRMKKTPRATSGGDGQVSLLATSSTTSSSKLSYPCPYPDCGKLFTRPSHLQKHLYIHTGERPHKCGFCDNAFKTKWTLKKHIRTHTGERPFSCSECHMKFTQRGSWRRHMQHHNIGIPRPKLSKPRSGFGLAGKLPRSNDKTFGAGKTKFFKPNAIRSGPPQVCFGTQAVLS